MRTTYYPEQYECPLCHTVQKHHVWSNEVQKAKHTCKTEGCKQKLTAIHIVEVPEVQAPAIKTMTKNRIQLDRKKRSHNHFVREILPTLPKGSIERGHHMVKNGYKATD